MVSVIIPARNETYLQKTIESILSAAEGEIEVIAICDGYWPDPPIQDDSRVHLIHHTESVGQRASINEGARLAKGKYILKTDAHSMFDKGFDVKLKADCEYNWTVIPRMYNLDAEKWEPKLHKKTDFMWIRSYQDKEKPLRHNYWDGRCARQYPNEYKAYKRSEYIKGDICDVMTGQGACFFMHTGRFWDLGGMDEAHGGWGAMGVEIALKAWLSGGRHVVNKKTWFAHWFRGGSGPGFPYQISGKDQQKARKYAIDLWTNGKWHLQKYPLEWLVKKFSPLPTWSNGSNPLPHTQEYAKTKLTQPATEIKKIKFKKLNSISPWINKGMNFDVNDLCRDRLSYARQDKLDGIRWLQEILPPIIKKILADDTFKYESQPYYEYLVSRLNPVVNPPSGPTPKGVKHVIAMIDDLKNLCFSIKNEGLKAPLDMFLTKENTLILTRGYRRLEILNQLGVKNVPVRVWRTEWLARHYIPTTILPTDNGSIHSHAVKQFVKYGYKSTDKYWKHSYTALYDKHIGHLKQGLRPKAILELGVMKGYSLILWRDSFPMAQVFGIDKNLSNYKFKGVDRIRLFKGDELDTDFLNSVAKEVGPFDVIIDDCLHQPKAMKSSLDTLWPHLKDGGVYVIEDLHPNYREDYLKDSIMPFLKDKVDEIWTNHKTREVAFYPNICFMTKA